MSESINFTLASRSGSADAYGIHFTFEITPQSGLADKLGVQFALLYALGKGCGWHYKRIEPVVFDRAQNFESKTERLAKRIAARLKLTDHQWYQNQWSGEPLADFLGLGQPDAELKDYRHVIEIPLAELLTNAESIETVNARVNQRIAECGIRENSSTILLRISKDHNFYVIKNLIPKLLGISGDQILAFAGSDYLRPRLDSQRSALIAQLSPAEPLTLAHIRLGDSLYLATDQGIVILHGNMGYFSLADYYKTIKPIDPERFPWFDPYQVSYRIERELASRQLDPRSLFIISDGFRSSRQALERSARAQPDRISRALLRAGHNKINELEQQFSRAFDWISPSNRVIGEGVLQTIQSIDLISKADLIMSNSGGFSLYMSGLYGKAVNGPPFIWLGKDV